jgi:hypothetical protein
MPGFRAPRWLPRLAAVLLLVPGAAGAQVPDTDIWLARVRFDPGGGLRLDPPVNVTKRPGYDNQPAFVDPETFLFARADAQGSTDIYRWSPAGIERVTRTPESEYSPTPYRGSRDGAVAGFDCVRVEADSAQRLWRFDIDGSNPRLVLGEVDSVGYFAWIDDGHVAVFVLGNEKRGEPHTLRIVDVRAQTETMVARDIGRAIHRIPNGSDISFTVHEDDDTYRFMVLRAGETSPRSLIDAVGSGQDAAWLGLGPVMLTSSGSAIHAASPGNREVPLAWRRVADFAGAGIAGVTRIAVSPDQSRIAFVATTTTP